MVLELIQKVYPQIKLRKCEFFYQEIKFLGHKISEKRIQTDEDKIKAMREVSTLTNIREVQSVIGLFNYYRTFVSNFSTIARLVFRTSRVNPG